jgi:hypothetical protein
MHSWQKLYEKKILLTSRFRFLAYCISEIFKRIAMRFVISCLYKKELPGELNLYVHQSSINHEGRRQNVFPLSFRPYSIHPKAKQNNSSALLVPQLSIYKSQKFEFQNLNLSSIKVTFT